jgi:aryl-alcohol dehydrogenase-like predicted oxidoreductase
MGTMTLAQRTLGREGLNVSALGLGCMSLTSAYGNVEESRALATLDRALDRGVTFFDTADVYGREANEQLIGRWLRGKRDRVVLATKFGNAFRDPERRVDGRPEYVRQACEDSLRRLGVDHIDLYYQHRVDPQVPIEETVGAMKRLVEDGKVRHLGLSEAAPATVRRADAIHHITALQTEYSLWWREPEREIIPTCRELGIGFVAYSPLGRGLLTGTIRSGAHFGEDDFRRNHPRFQGDNLQHNLRMVEAVEGVAREKGVTAAQLALAWVLARGEDVVPIPGTSRPERIDENLGALALTLTPEDLHRLEAAAPVGAGAGERYPDFLLRYVDG